MKEKNESKRNVKICVVMLLNNYWKIKFLYWVWWRWLYYVCDLDDVEVLRVANVAKKIPSAASSLLTILATDDGRDDDDDDDGAKSYPSRTSWGAAYSLGEKFGFLLERKFGVRAYDYWWGYSSAQIDLMVADQPLVVYPKRDRKMTKKRAEAAYAKWKERKAQEKETLIGKKVSLADFLK